MMCLVLRFKACTVCKTVGAWTSTLFSAQSEKCQLKAKHVGYAIFPASLATSPPLPLALSPSTTMTYLSNNMSAVKMTGLSKYRGRVSRVEATAAYLRVTV